MTPQRRVIIAEDDVEMREMLAVSLEQAGFCVDQASDGIELARLISGGRSPALIICDIQMPRQNGLSALEQLRRTSAASVPIVVISAYADDAAAQRIAALGNATLLRKPFALSELRRLALQLSGR
ncbi:MAG: response regulator [Deltaproteobacteria bacterium]|nr:response regulator [Deltaproteobacteria bacterium]